MAEIETTLITGANVWDGTSETAVPQEILVVGDRIQQLGERIEAPTDARKIDLSGHTLTPGFIDCHTHVTLAPPVGVAMALDSSVTKTLKSLPVLRCLLMNGFTTVRDLGCGDVDYPTIDLRNAVATGLVVGPRMVVAPHMISARGGHGDFSGMVADEYQGCCRQLELAAADGGDEIRTRVRQQIRAGADWIKFAATGGFASPSDDPRHTTYSEEEMKVLVETSADLAIPVTTHSYGDEAIKRAVSAGVRSVEHGNLASADTLKRMEDADVFLVPTQYVILSAAKSDKNDPDWAMMSDYMRRKLEKYRDELIAAAERVAKSNVRIAFGTDAGMFPHENNVREFPTMVSTGITELRALRAATSVAAELLRLDDRGEIKQGKIADLIAMPGNPLVDINVTGKVDFVMKSGVICKDPTQAGKA
jgi:imidazolonepropionase-like amidohydrolase